MRLRQASGTPAHGPTWQDTKESMSCASCHRGTC
ncbi:MAG: CxxxxCH/CxxCH domain-containing protein [Rhodocyclaceae bacterium]|nr:CxxxxCH/CxxCH domain-containing protein [Rhodocyclaceae bacterium]